MASGRCLCGAVRYETDAALRPVVACHCSQCRLSSGFHVAATSAPRDAVRIEGAVTWFASSSEARRGFCGTCGSNLFWDGGGASLSIMAGTLDAPTGLAMAGHIFVGDKPDWYAIADGLPQAEGRDPTLTTRVEG